MLLAQKFEERVVRVEKPSAHFTLLRNEKGDFLGISEGKTVVFDHADDKTIWGRGILNAFYGDRSSLQGVPCERSGGSTDGAGACRAEKSRGKPNRWASRAFAITRDEELSK